MSKKMVQNEQKNVPYDLKLVENERNLCECDWVMKCQAAMERKNSQSEPRQLVFHFLVSRQRVEGVKLKFRRLEFSREFDRKFKIT